MSSATAEPVGRLPLTGSPPTATRMGPKPALTHLQIADAAVAIADAEGIAAVSMQRVAAAFDYTKMSLYRYFPSKDDLGAAMIDRAVGAPPDVGTATGWRPRLEAWTRLLAESWEAHPWLPLATVGDRTMGPNELGWIERAISILADTPLAADEQTALVLLICGHLRSTHSVETAGTQPWSGGRQRELVHGEEFRELAKILDGPAAEPTDRGRAFGLTCILGGVEAVIAQRTPTRSPKQPAPKQPVPKPRAKPTSAGTAS